MVFYDKLKQLYDIVKDNGCMDALQMILDLQREILDYEKDMIALQNENKSLKENAGIVDKIIRHDQPFPTIQNDSTGVLYCAHCWDADRKLIQVGCKNNGKFICPHCKSDGIYDEEMHRNSHHVFLPTIL